LYETNVAQSKANLARSEAGVEQVKANLALAEKELVRSKDLAKKDLISKFELDTAVATCDSLKAQLKSAEASVQQSQSALQTAQVNLEYTTIKSPVNGVVISRNVNEGQTVVASLSAQTIFVIATDLKKVQVEANIPEADIGKIEQNDPVTFTVDAYPDMEFYGTVTQVRLSSTTVQNVVTYTVIITADNPDEKLYPGMTANLICEVDRRPPDTLKVPNAALRFKPEPNLMQIDSASSPAPSRADSAKIPSERGGVGNDKTEGSREDKPDFKGMSGPPRPGPESIRGTRQPWTKEEDKKHAGRSAQVWIRGDKGLLKAVNIKVGISDGSFTEVVKGDLSVGQEIITGVITREEAAEMNNPLGPPRFPGRRR
jgi:HlyD family secretion protein